VVEGEGATLVDGVRLEWETNDIFCVPGWAAHEHANQSSTRPAQGSNRRVGPSDRRLGAYPGIRGAKSSDAVAAPFMGAQKEKQVYDLRQKQSFWTP